MKWKNGVSFLDSEMTGQLRQPKCTSKPLIISPIEVELIEPSALYDSLQQIKPYYWVYTKDYL